MPRGKKVAVAVTSVANAVASVAVANTVMYDGTSSTMNKPTDLKTFLFKLRDLCRNKGAQMDENGNVYADLIYDDLLFLKNVWRLAESKRLTLDVPAVLDGFPIADIQLSSLASMGKSDQALVGAAFKRLWTQLQRSNLKDIFDRDFALTSMLKDEKLKTQYLPLLTALLDYVGGVLLAPHEDTDPYEYFTQNLKKAKSKYFGQFYTPQAITESCVKEIVPRYGELGMDTMAGTSKFMRAAATYIHKHQPEYTEWDAFQFMRTVEIESKIYRQGVMSTFAKYNQLPNLSHIRKGDAFDLLSKEDEQYDYILGNPPYGGTVDGFEELYYDVTVTAVGNRIKTTKAVKPEIRHPFPFVKKDTSVLAIQLIVNKLKVGGRAAVVFNGTIMNDSHRDVMKWFLDSCDLRKVIVNPGGTFKCTSIETYSLIFWKGAPTERIEYVEFGTDKTLGSFTRAEFEARGLDIRPIFASKTTVNEIFTKMPLGDIITLHKGDLQATKCDGGEFPVIAISEKRTHSNYSVDGEYVYIASTSSGNSSGPFKTEIKYYNGKCGITSLMQRIAIKDKHVCLYKYLYYYLLFNKTNVETSCEKGVANKSLDKEKFLAYSLPLPPLETQQEIVATLDRIYAPGTTDLADTLKLTSQAMDLVLATPSGAKLEPIVEAQRLIRKSAQMVADVKAQMTAIMKSVGSRGFEEKKLSEICDFVGGKGNYKKDGDAYPYYDSNGITGTRKDFLYDGEYIITARKMSIGAVHYVSGKFWPSDNTIVMRTKPDTDIIASRFLYYWLLMNNDLLKALTSGIKPGIRKSDVVEIKMPVPPLDFQQSIITRLTALESQVAALESLQRSTEDNARFILESYLGAKGSGEPVAEGAAEAGEEDAEEDSEELVANTLTHA